MNVEQKKLLGELESKSLPFLVKMYEQAQTGRKAMKNLLLAAGQGRLNAGNPPKLVFNYIAEVVAHEKLAGKAMKLAIENHPLGEFLLGTKGVGAGTSIAKVLSRIDWEKATTFAKLKRFCGYAVIDGQAERKKKGSKNHYSSAVRSNLYIIGQGFLKKSNKSTYRKVYDKQKKRIAKRICDVHGDIHNRKLKNGEKKTKVLSRKGGNTQLCTYCWNTMHPHSSAVRYMMTAFLRDMWREAVRVGLVKHTTTAVTSGKQNRGRKAITKSARVAA